MKGAGHEVEILWRGRRVHAFVPDALRSRDLELDAPTATRVGAAAAAIVHAAEALGPDIEVLARLLLRSEGVASSYVEGVTAPIVDVVLAEEHFVDKSDSAAWVASNLAAIDEALASATKESPLSVSTVCSWHRILMTGSPTPARHVGVMREEQGWIGGTSPLDAHLVTPPPAALPQLMDDLIDYANRTDVDPIVQAAVGHAQFELIHPFADGNGRIGRILSVWLLIRRLRLVVPPPLSVSVAADVGGYTSGLVLFRLGDHNAWIRWFCDAVVAGGNTQQALISSVERMQERWQAKVKSGERKLRSDATALRTLEVLPRHLILTSKVLADELKVTRKTAIAALQRLVDAGILWDYGSLEGIGRGPRSRLYVSPELLGLAGSRPLSRVTSVE